MTPIPDRREWTNVQLSRTLTDDQFDWMCNNAIGMFHIHNFQHCVKFEREQDAVLFTLRWR